MKSLFLALCLTLPQVAFAACHAVGPTSAGLADGSSWTNRTAYPTNPTRGDTYYFMDGSYGSQSFAKANSGSTTITFKKAQSYDFGRTADGCSNDISAGWVPATMGAGQATFTNFGNNCATCGFFILDGNGQTSVQGCGAAPTANQVTTDCGFKFTVASGSSGPLDIGVNAGGANRTVNWTIRYLEIAGPGDVVVDQNFIWCHGGCDNLVIDHAWWHESACVFIKLPWTSATTVKNSYFKQNFSDATCHGQFYLSEVTTSNVDLHNNVFSDIQGTGLMVIVTGGQASNYTMYNNILLRPSGSSRPGFSNGLWACINASSKCTNIVWSQNSVINYAVDSPGSLGILDEHGGGSYTWQNNIFYSNPSTSIAFTLNGSTLTENHNSWLNSGSPAAGTGDVTVTTAAPNPFTNWPASDFTLASQNADWTGGATLLSPFNVDAVGTARPGADAQWDRGAFEFVSGTPQVATPTFSPVAGTYASTQSVTLSTSTGGATLCFTTDGTTPTANGAGTCTHGTTYSTPVSVATSETLLVIGSLSGDTDSAVASATYTIGIPVASLSPSSLAFGGINISNSSASQALTLQNTGTAVMSITSISLTGANSGDFFQSNNCPVGSNLGNGASCTITVTFTPLAVGARSASVSVVDGASGSPHTSTLSGTGVQASISCKGSPGAKLSGRATVK